jgi:hypothetical protein
MNATPEELLELVSRSPAAVFAHEKQVWLDLFSSDAVVHDPVGTVPHRRRVSDDRRSGGEDPLSRFWETFIAPNRISFTVYQDIVVSGEVVRDVSIRTELAGGFAVEVPSYLIYRMTEENGVVRIGALRAHWELRSMLRRVLGGGWGGFTTQLRMAWRMLAIQGMAGWLGYLKGLTRGIFGRGRQSVRDFASALNARDEKALRALCDAEETRIEYPAGVAESVPEFLAGAGHDLRMDVSGVISAGWSSACVFWARRGEVTHHGVAFFEFNPKTKRIRSARFFWNV